MNNGTWQYCEDGVVRRRDQTMPNVHYGGNVLLPQHIHMLHVPNGNTEEFTAAPPTTLSGIVSWLRLMPQRQCSSPP